MPSPIATERRSEGSHKFNPDPRENLDFAKQQSPCRAKSIDAIYCRETTCVSSPRDAPQWPLPFWQREISGCQNRPAPRIIIYDVAHDCVRAFKSCDNPIFRCVWQNRHVEIYEAFDVSDCGCGGWINACAQPSSRTAQTAGRAQPSARNVSSDLRHLRKHAGELQRPVHFRDQGIEPSSWDAVGPSVSG